MIYILILLFSLSSFADIEGGEKTTDPKYKHFIQIKSKDGYSCSATQVAYNKILTAAHCVISIGANSQRYLYKKGDRLNSNTIISVIANDDYIKYSRELAKLQTEDPSFLEVLKYKKYGYVSVITTEAKEDNNSYPKVISYKTKFKDRSKVEIVGYGATKTEYSGKKMYYVDSGFSKEAVKGTNTWATCPINYPNKSLQEVNSLINQLEKTLSITGHTIHSISGKVENQTHSKSMLLPGDSGSSTIEYDVNDDLVVTSISSNVNRYITGSGKPILIIESPTGKIHKFELKEMPEAWGDKNKEDLKFSVIWDKLRSLKLVRMGLVKYGVKITRQYTRVARANFADLLHPNNQKFLMNNL